MLHSIASFMVAKKSNLETMQNLGETRRGQTIASAWHIDCFITFFWWLAALLGKLSVLPKRRKPLWGSCGSTRPPHFRCLRSIDNRFCDGQPCAEVPQRPGRGVRLTAPAGVFLCFFYRCERHRRGSLAIRPMMRSGNALLGNQPLGFAVSINSSSGSVMRVPVRLNTTGMTSLDTAASYTNPRYL